MPKQQISDYVSLRTYPKIDTAKNIASKLNVHIEELYDWESVD